MHWWSAFANSDTRWISPTSPAAFRRSFVTWQAGWVAPTRGVRAWSWATPGDGGYGPHRPADGVGLAGVRRCPAAGVDRFSRRERPAVSTGIDVHRRTVAPPSARSRTIRGSDRRPAGRTDRRTAGKRGNRLPLFVVAQPGGARGWAGGGARGGPGGVGAGGA